jgi:hypothetical protein
MFKMKERKLEAQRRVYQEKWEDMDILAKRVIKLFASFAVKWDQLQNNANFIWHYEILQKDKCRLLERKLRGYKLKKRLFYLLKQMKLLKQN